VNISLFGGTGFIGSHFINRFKDEHFISVRERWNRRPVPDSDTLWFISTTHNYWVFKDASEDVRTNLLALTESLDSFRNETPNGTFNFISSWFVYGDHGGYPVNEAVSCYPRGFYSITKYTAEQLLQSYCETHNLKWRILRLGNVVGPGDHYSAQKNALQFLINEMKEGRDIKLYNGGYFYRNYMHVYDTVEAIGKVIERGVKNQIYNIGHPDERKFVDHIHKAAEIIGYDPRRIGTMDPKPFHRQVQTESFRMDTHKLRYEIGFRPELTLDAMIDDITR